MIAQMDLGARLSVPKQLVSRLSLRLIVNWLRDLERLRPAYRNSFTGIVNATVLTTPFR